MVSVGGKSVPWKSGMTLAEAVEASGILTISAILVLDGTAIMRDKRSLTLVRDEARISVLPLMSGG